MLKKIEKNWFFLLFVIAFVFICIANNTVDSDIWFLLNNGKYVINNGFPLVDPFTLHEGLNYIIQQWLSSYIFYKVFDIFGKTGLLILLYIVSFLLIFVYYKLSYISCKSKSRAVIITTLVFSFISLYIVHRPQIFTYLILITEILLLELYVQKGNNKYLYFLPILSVLLVNFHSSMWYFQFVFILPFLLNAIKIKNVTIDKVKIKPLIIVIFFMIVGGFINPYGYKSLLYIFKSYGMSEINNNIGEMKAIDFSIFPCKMVLLSLFLVICLCNFKKELKLDIRHFLFICGTAILCFMHAKGFPYYVFAFFYAFSYLIKDLKINFKLKSKYLKALIRGLKLGVTIMLALTFFVTMYFSIKEFSFGNYDEGEVIDYIRDNYDVEKVRLYVDFNNGGYAEYLGMKSYIDARAELFFKKYNGKSDIFAEYLNVDNDSKNFNYEEFVNKYKFTHLIVEPNTYLEEYLDNCDEYDMVYEKHYNSDINNIVTLKVYSLKDEGGLE